MQNVLAFYIDVLKYNLEVNYLRNIGKDVDAEILSLWTKIIFQYGITIQLLRRFSLEMTSKELKYHEKSGLLDITKDPEKQGL